MDDTGTVHMTYTATLPQPLSFISMNLEVDKPTNVGHSTDMSIKTAKLAQDSGDEGGGGAIHPSAEKYGDFVKNTGSLGSVKMQELPTEEVIGQKLAQALGIPMEYMTGKPKEKNLTFKTARQTGKSTAIADSMREYVGEAVRGNAAPLSIVEALESLGIYGDAGAGVGTLPNTNAAYYPNVQLTQDMAMGLAQRDVDRSLIADLMAKVEKLEAKANEVKLDYRKDAFLLGLSELDATAMIKKGDKLVFDSYSVRRAFCKEDIPNAIATEDQVRDSQKINFLMIETGATGCSFTYSQASLVNVYLWQNGLAG